MAAVAPGPLPVKVVSPHGELGSAVIELSTYEAELFNVLKMLLNDRGYPMLHATNIRVAGGWVRDKVRHDARLPLAERRASTSTAI
jgi:hypothetical protein